MWKQGGNSKPELWVEADARAACERWELGVGPRGGELGFSTYVRTANVVLYLQKDLTPLHKARGPQRATFPIIRR